MMPVRRLFLAVMLASLAAGGCATARAKAQPLPVPLEAPAPPPRIIVPPEPQAPPPPPSPEPESRAVRPPKRPVTTMPARPEPKVDVPRPAPPPPPAPTLQQALPTSPADLVRQVREQLVQAQSDLGRVDYVGLSADGQAQYDTAKRFIVQAEQALTEKNLVFAAKVAEKAAMLAASLVGREQV